MKLDVFVAGEIVDLCIPTRAFAEQSDWYAWFNDRNINRYLYQGLFPNTAEQQVRFFEENRDKRLLLIVSDKANAIGVISLNNIDFVAKQADLAMVIGPKCPRKLRPYVSLEAIARITQHAVEVMGLNRINSGQHVGLGKWQQRKELLGYRLEGVLRNGFVKGREVADLMKSSLVYADYARLVARRGAYWDSLEKMKARIKQLPDDKFIDQFVAFMARQGEAYYERVFEL